MNSTEAPREAKIYYIGLYDIYVYDSVLFLIVFSYLADRFYSKSGFLLLEVINYSLIFIEDSSEIA